MSTTDAREASDGVGPAARPRAGRRGARHRLTANLFGIPLGLAGVAQCWAVAHDLGTAPTWPADVLWVITAAVWLLVAGAYYARHHRPADLARELADPTFGPFVAVSAIVPMMLGAAVARQLPTVGHVVFLVALVLTLVAGGWLSGQWILSETTLAQWHPGYFLPTVGGGLIAAGLSAGFGDRWLAQVMFGYGTVCWIVLGSIILTRLFTQPQLPVPLRTTIAIEMAPPVVAGIAWFRINGGQVDAIALGLAGYALLMAMIQIRLIPLFRTVPFGPGWWAFSFPYAATVAYALQWLSVQPVTGVHTWTWAFLVIVTAGAAVLAGRTVMALVGDRFLPPGAPATPDPVGAPLGRAHALDHEAPERSASR
ncbi:MAG: hypothetical protein AVDCRST_MAG52-3019 [uncultured Blastococcus sp.]|uniref:Tellurite resistance protein TehA n=1 Tax=uncultured Blastococcus sp. TaxID=217144 RepID=A0A6J4J2Q2_9ACTN|nr:MAG: hypothetical protein AVDCRST_MAG52-3019 [uncultured Blastococcus sp.]